MVLVKQFDVTDKMLNRDGDFFSTGYVSAPLRCRALFSTVMSFRRFAQSTHFQLPTSCLFGSLPERDTASGPPSSRASTVSEANTRRMVPR